MQVSRELDYGVRAVVVLATHEGETLSKRRIAEEFKIPVNFLALILPKLVRSGIVESLPGPKGGYRLARQATEVSIYDILMAVDGELAFNRCLEENLGCEMKSQCPVSPFWLIFQQDAIRSLKGATLDRIVGRHFG